MLHRGGEGGHLLGVLNSTRALAVSTARSGNSGQVLAASLSGLADLLDGDLSLLGTAGLDDRSDEALNLGGLQAVLLAILGHTAAHNVLAHIILAGEVEQLADAVGALGAETAGSSRVSETLDLGVTALGDGDVQNGNITGNNATTDVLAAALTLVATEGVVTNGSALEEEGNTAGSEHSGHHGETILIRSSAETEHVSGELLSENSTIDIIAQTVVQEVHTAENFFGDIEGLDGSVAGEGDVELHFEITTGEREKDRKKR